MQPTKIRTFFLANLLTLGICFDAGAVSIMGARSCGDWVKYEKQDGILSTAQNAWLVGYLSGLANGMGIDVLKNISAQSLYLWVGNYCKSNPLDDSDDAGNKLFLELKKRAGL